MKAGSVRIATTPVLADTILPRAIERFLAAHPKVQLTIRNMLNMEVVERVAMEEADFGLVLSPDNYRGSTAVDLHKTELIGVVPAGHPLVAKGHIDLEDATRFPLISFSRPMFWLAAAGVMPSWRAPAAMLPCSTALTKLSMLRRVSICLSSGRRDS